MLITPDPEFRAYILDSIRKREFSERTGVHCSDLIYCLNKQALRKLCPKPDEESSTLIFSLGWATQRWLTGVEKDVPTKEVDGIQVTLDALYLSCPWELKATFQSSDKPIAENMHWLRQCMAQCYVNKSTEARLSRFELMGNWKSVFGKKEDKQLPENRKPTLSAYKLSFSDIEIEGNWDWLKGRRDIYLEILETKVLKPAVVAIPTGQTWECDYCIYKDKECTL